MEKYLFAKKAGIIVSGILFIMFIIAVPLRLLFEKPIEEVDFFIETERPMIFAHRGYSMHYPENTILAFKKALEAGADALEMDLWYTSDGTVVVHHDPTVKRTTDGEGYVQNMTFDELREFDAGYSFTTDGGQTFPFRNTGVHIPSLEEVFKEFPDAYFNLEMKARDEKMGRLLAEIIEKHDMGDRVLAASFFCEPLQEFRRLLPDVQTSASRREVRGFYITSVLRLSFMFPHQYEAFQIPLRYGNVQLDRNSFIRSAHRSGLRVFYWTINDRDQMIGLFQKNACGIVTDDVSTAVQVIRDIENGVIKLPESQG